jgi:hypothetical protein
MREIRPEQVINGSWGEVWIDGDYVAEVTGLTATLEIEYEDVNRPRKLGTAKKMMGYSGTGSVKLNKVTSRFIKLLSDNLKNGRQTSVDIISKLDDPDAVGAERIVIKNATFENLSLANWEAKTKGEEEVNFSFDDWEPLDLIED